MKKYFFGILIIVFISGCYWGRNLEKNQKIKIIDDFIPDIDNSISSVYINNNNADNYQTFCIDELRSNLEINNVTLINNNTSQIDFTVVIDKLLLQEKTKTETVNDESSPYNGQSYELIVCDVDIKFKLYKGDVKDNYLIDTYSINVNKEEKITNNRNLGDYMFGTNKDNSEYRQKLLSDDIFKTLSEKAGRRTSAKVTTKISKRIKQ